MMLVYTSITKSYLPKARVLAKSVKHFHPEWIFVLLYSDDLPIDFDLKKEPFDEVLTIEQLGLPDWKAWAFGHAVVELCTAVKGPAAELLAQRPGVNKIMYIDPDIKVFNSLSSLDSMLDQHEILLTPHLLDAETDINAIQDNEISALKHGVYNLGFFAARTSGQGLDFIRWWAARLRLFCRDDIPGGLFTDQRWCDLAPAFFSGLSIVRDRGFNVATWNIAHRHLSKDDNGVFLVGDVPLRFYHFTSYDNGNGFGMLMKYASSQAIAHELWDAYGKDLLAEGQGDERYKGWYYGQFENGESIPLEARRLYRTRPDVQKIFPNPFSVEEPCFLTWWKAEVVQGNLTVQNAVGIRQKSVIGRVIQGVCSPRVGIGIVKSAVGVLKREGFSGLIRQIRNY
ncbi:MAG: glycosyl transferase [Candidatus Gracilibacteria bacterium]